MKKCLKIDLDKFDSDLEYMVELEQKSLHIWNLIKAANKAGVKTFVSFPNYKLN